MRDLSNLLSILVVSYDGYSDLWKDFFTLKNQNWSDCPFKTYLANNQLEYNDNNVIVLNCGKDAKWSDRARYALEIIPTKYVCLMVEDFYISQKVNTQNVFDDLLLMEENGINYMKLQTMGSISTPKYHGKEEYQIIPANLKYGVSLTCAIWKKDYIISLIGSGSYNPWEFEINQVNIAKSSDESMEIKGVFDNRNVLNICHMVVQAKYIPASIRFLRKQGYIINPERREVLNGFSLLLFHLKHFFYPLLGNSRYIRKIMGKLGVKSVESQNTNISKR